MTSPAGAEWRTQLNWRQRPLRWAGFRLLDATARLGANILLLLFGRSPQPASVPSSAAPLTIVLPILPDLSHTFVYRETLAILRQRPDTRVLCLEHNHGAPQHAEVTSLLPHVRFVPHRGVVAHYLDVFGSMLRRPRRTACLLALYAQRSGGSAGDLFGKNPLRDARHPGRAFALARALNGSGHVHVYGSTYAANVVMGAALLTAAPFSISSYVDFDFAYDFKMLDEKYRRATFFRVCTQYCQRRLRELIGAVPARTPVVLWGLELDAWPRAWQPAGTGRLFTACRIVAKKGLHLLPPALAELRDAGIAFAWRIAGTGPELERLRSLVRQHRLDDRVTFLGALHNDAVRRELEQADLFVLPCVIAADGERDGIPIAITEAMATGVPVLTTPVSGIPEVVRDGDTGFLVAPDDVPALAARLRELLVAPERTRDVAARGRREIEATHSVDDSATALLRCIDEGSA